MARTGPFVDGSCEDPAILRQIHVLQSTEMLGNLGAQRVENGHVLNVEENFYQSQVIVRKKCGTLTFSKVH